MLPRAVIAVLFASQHMTRTHLTSGGAHLTYRRRNAWAEEGTSWAYNTGGRSRCRSSGAPALLGGFSLGFKEGVKEPGGLPLGARHEVAVAVLDRRESESSEDEGDQPFIGRNLTH